MPSLVRHADWQTPFVAALSAARARPFEVGVFDCCLFAADVVLAMTGTDMAADFRGKYTTDVGAMRVLKRLYGGDLADCAHALGVYYGAPLIAPGLARRGDIALVDGEGGRPAIGVVVDHRVATPARPAGLALVPVRAARAVWAIGVLG